jgi:hypothetical protein
MLPPAVGTFENPLKISYAMPSPTPIARFARLHDRERA